MATIRESARQYEDWLRKQLHGDVLEQDLAKKHDKMWESAFVFLRATYWRWAETIFDVCPDLAGGTQVLASVAPRGSRFSHLPGTNALESRYRCSCCCRLAGRTAR